MTQDRVAATAKDEDSDDAFRRDLSHRAYPYKQSFNPHLFCVSMTSCGNSSSKTVSKKFSNIKKLVVWKLSGMTSDNSILKKT